MVQGLSPHPPQAPRHVDINPDIPAYRIIDKRGFFDDSDHLWPKDSMIYWEGRPCSGFEALNELAEEKLRAYFVELDEKAKQVSEKNGKGHASLVNAYEARRRIQEMDRRAGRSVDQEEMTPIMGGKRREKKLAHSVYDPAASDVPLMGHRARGTAMERKARDASKQTNKGFI